MKNRVKPWPHPGPLGKKLVVLVGTRKAIWMAVKRLDSMQRITTLRERLKIAAGLHDERDARLP